MKALFRWIVLPVLLLIILIVMAVAFAPAKIIYMATQRWVPQVEMSEPTGTIWQGESNSVVVSVDKAKLDLGKVNWNISRWSLLQLTPEIDVALDAGTHKAKASVSATGITTDPQSIHDVVVTVDNMEGDFPLSMLEPWVPMLVKGDLAFVVDHVIFNPQELLSIDGALNLQQADWLGGDEPMPLGSYIAQVSLADNKDIMVQLNDFSATLGIDGYLAVNPRGTYKFNSVLQARPGLASEVAESIVWFGKKNDEGDVVVNRSGRWR